MRGEGEEHDADNSKQQRDFHANPPSNRIALLVHVGDKVECFGERSKNPPCRDQEHDERDDAGAPSFGERRRHDSLDLELATRKEFPKELGRPRCRPGSIDNVGCEHHAQQQQQQRE